MVVLPVFLQAPWVRLDPFSATLFTGVLVAAGLVMHQSRSQTTSDLGSLLVGFSGSWLAGCIFWGWLRAHPVLHLPVEAFAVPVALGGLQGRWRLAATFYLSSLVGTACTDLAMAATGVMQFWPTVVTPPSIKRRYCCIKRGHICFSPCPWSLWWSQQLSFCWLDVA